MRELNGVKQAIRPGLGNGIIKVRRAGQGQLAAWDTSQQVIERVGNWQQMRGPAEAPGSLGSQLEQRVGGGRTDARFPVDLLSRQFGEHSLHPLADPWIGVMIGGGDQRTVRFKKQVISCPRIATDAIHRLFVGSDRAQAVQGFLIQVRDVPLERVFVFDREVLEPAHLADRKLALVQGPKHYAAGFRTQVAGDIEIAHLTGYGCKYRAFSAD